MKALIWKILKILAKLTIKRYNPLVIGITGSVGKTSAREAVFAVVSFAYNARRNRKNYNNEIGLPLTILGFDSPGKNIFGWIAVFLKSFWKIIFKDDNYPEVLVLEMGADKPGDIKYLLNIANPKIGVVTAIGEIPVHVEFFSGPKHLAREKSRLVRALPVDGYAILNYDDEVVFEMKDATKAHILTYGVGERAQILALNYEIKTENINGAEVPLGISFKVEYNGNTVPFRLNNCFGKQQLYAVLAAVGVGIALDINLVEISEALLNYKMPPPGRLRLLKGIKNSWILDDTYNASPASMAAALETLKEINSKRKIVVLGDMLEIGKYTVEAHQSIGSFAAKTADLIITVGSRAKFIASEAVARGFDEKNIFEFDESVSAGKFLQQKIEENDIILIKGSQSMRMERVVEDVMAEPEKTKELLVRQDW